MSNDQKKKKKKKKNMNNFAHHSPIDLSLRMGPMPAIVDLWGYDVQNCSSSSSSSSSDCSTPITQKQSNIKT